MSDQALARHWLDAAADSAIAGELQGVYAEVAAAVAARGPACWASGRCCSFAKTGHLLYATGLEAAYALARLPRGRPALTPGSLADALVRGTCPFLAGHLCGAHAVRPLGCRVYFCDRSAQEWQRELSERLIARVREAHDRHAVEYRYAEWRSLLSMFMASA